MGTQRTSNKDILDAINGLGDSIANAIANAMTQNASAPAQPEAASSEPTEQSVKVPQSYRDHVMAKVQDKCDSDGEDRVLYARRNLNGETKLAYCLASRWTTLKDNGLIGAIAHVTPAS